jgi:diguanylate cyclase (GGDEF)-like protein
MPEPLLTWQHWLFSTDSAQRLRLRQTGLALLLMALCGVLMAYGAWTGVMSTAAVEVWALCSVGGMVIFFAVIRSGLALRVDDPSLTVPQMLFAMLSSVSGYAMLGPMRGAVFPVLALIMMFAMFSLSVRAALGIAAYTLLLFGAVMFWMSQHRPELYPPSVEFVHFLVLCVALPGISVLAGRVNRIRERLRAQREELSRAVDQIRAMATRDELTGLLNRRHMQTILEQEAQRCLRGGHGYCLALIDLDHFKSINDRYGHGAGDAVLRQFAAIAQTVIRGADVIARWGGEEFVLMLAETRMPAARAGVERLRQAVELGVIRHQGRDITFTLSAGLTESLPRETLNQTLERADKLLYKAKHEGRNRVVFD